MPPSPKYRCYHFDWAKEQLVEFQEAQIPIDLDGRTNICNVFPLISGGKGCAFSRPGFLWPRGRVHATFTPVVMGKTIVQ